MGGPFTARVGFGATAVALYCLPTVQKRPIWVYIGHEKKRVAPLEAEHLHDIKLPGAGL